MKRYIDGKRSVSEDTQRDGRKTRCKWAYRQTKNEKTWTGRE